MRRVFILGVLVGLAGCDRRQPEADAARPRLVTFSPALTKLAFDLGLGDHVVGVTSYCRLPAGETRTVVGNALSVRAEPVLAVKPDVVLVQMEPKHFESLVKMAPHIQIEHFQIETLADVARAMRRIGRLVGQDAKGAQAASRFEEKLNGVQRQVASLPKRKVLFVTGYQNPMGAGGNTFIDEMIGLAGGANVLAGRFEGWKKLSIETVLETAPQVIICQAQPKQQSQARAYWQTLGQGSGGGSRRVYVVTDTTWTIAGTHLADFTLQMARMIHPELAEREPQP